LNHTDQKVSLQIFLLNLDRSPDRLSRFRERNSHLMGMVQRVSATDGTALDRDELLRSGYILDDLTYNAGALGCAMSHIRLWERVIAENRNITIFEDDVVTSSCFFETSNRITNALPADWDIIQWGYLFNPLFVWVDLGISKARLHCYGPKLNSLAEFEDIPTVPTALRLLHCFGTAAYSISPSGARAALEYCLPLRHRYITFPDAGVTTIDEGIDCALCGIYPRMKAYLSLPQLAAAFDDGLSDRKATDNLPSPESACGRIY
jgi:GR25 family glycosyltransferase involved in LPS biosynthesis